MSTRETKPETTAEARRIQALLFAILVIVVAAGLKVFVLAEGVDAIVHSRGDATQNARTDWRDSAGVSTNLTTWRDPREDDAEFIDRHERAVREMTKAKGNEADAWRIERR